MRLPACSHLWTPLVTSGNQANTYRSLVALSAATPRRCRTIDFRRKVVRHLSPGCRPCKQHAHLNGCLSPSCPRDGAKQCCGIGPSRNHRACRTIQGCEILHMIRKGSGERFGEREYPRTDSVILETLGLKS